MRYETKKKKAVALGHATYEGPAMRCGHKVKVTATGRCAACPAPPVRSTRDGARAAAQAAGERFYQGAPCRHGHDGKRYTSKGQCYACQVLTSRTRDRTTEHRRLQRETWKAANPEKVKAWRKRATARLRQAICDGTLNAESLGILLALQGGCAYCGSSDDLQLDHKQPISRGGAHSLTNAQWLCQYHNGSKGAQTDAEYRDRYLIVDVTPWDAL